MEPAITIVVVTFVLAGVSVILRRKLIDRKKQKELQHQTKEDQKRWKELFKEAEKNKKEIEELQNQMMKRNMELMNLNMKFSLTTLPIFLGAFWLLGYLLGGASFEYLFPLPRFEHFGILNPVSWVPACVFDHGACFVTTTGYYKAYFFTYLIFSILFSIVEKIYDTAKGKMGQMKASKKENEKNNVKAEEKKVEENKNVNDVTVEANKN